MPIDPVDTIYYKQTRFTTRLPKSHWYSPSHYWLAELAPGRYRVGLTKFAMRMLGDFVELGFNIETATMVSEGEAIGWIEGFKALSDIYCIAEGKFLGGNEELNTEPQLVDKDPYDRGWLFDFEGELPPSVVDVQGYIAILDATIERMLAEQQGKEEPEC